MSLIYRSSEKIGGREEKQYYILSRGLCLTQTTLHRGILSWGMWVRAAPYLTFWVKSHHWL